MNSVTVVIPAYKCLSTIDECLESVFLQTLSEFCVLIIVDGPDAKLTNSIALWTQRFETKGRRFNLVSFDVNLGQAHARNYAANLVSTDYVAFLDSDDIWSKSYLADQLNYIDSQKMAGNIVSFVYSNSISFSNERLIKLLKRKKSVNNHYVIWKNGIGCPSGVVFSIDIYKAGILHDSSFRSLEDWEWYGRVTKSFSAYYNQNAWFFYRISNDSVTSCDSLDAYISALRIINSNYLFYKRGDFFDLLAVVASSRLSRRYSLLDYCILLISALCGSSIIDNFKRSLFYSFQKPFAYYFRSRANSQLPNNLEVTQKISDLRKR